MSGTWKEIQKSLSNKPSGNRALYSLLTKALLHVTILPYQAVLMKQVVDSPKSLVIFYESGKKITLGQEEAAQVLSLYFSQRQQSGDLIGDIGYEEPKQGLIKRIDNFIIGLIERFIK